MKKTILRLLSASTLGALMLSPAVANPNETKEYRKYINEYHQYITRNTSSKGYRDFTKIYDTFVDEQAKYSDEAFHNNIRNNLNKMDDDNYRLSGLNNSFIAAVNSRSVIRDNDLDIKILLVSAMSAVPDVTTVDNPYSIAVGMSHQNKMSAFAIGGDVLIDKRVKITGRIAIQPRSRNYAFNAGAGVNF